MIFDEKTHKVKHQLLTDKEEAKAFIKFLEIERERHIREVVFSDRCIGMHKYVLKTYNKAMVALWYSQVLRHNEDIEAIDISIAEVKDRLKL